MDITPKVPWYMGIFLIPYFAIKDAYENVAKPKKSIPALHSAIYNGKNLDEVVKLIQQGEDVNGKDSHGDTPLHYAFRRGRLEIVKHLIENGANVNLKNNRLESPFYYAFWNSDIETMKLMIENGANIIDRDSLGLTPLHVACRTGRLAMVKLLLKKGAHVDVNTKYNSQTPLHITVYTIDISKETLEIVKVLIENKADLRSKDKEGNTALENLSEMIILEDDTEKENRRKKILDYLQSLGARK